MAEKLVTMGRTVGVYGIKGWLRVKPYTEQIDSLAEYRHWFLKFKDQWQAMKLEAIRAHGKGLVAKLEGIDQPEQAALFTQCDIAIEQTQLPKLGANEFYWYELLGLKVVNALGQELGRIDRMMETGANDVMVIKPETVLGKEKEVLIPYIWGDVVKQVDLQSEQVLVDWQKDWE